MNQKFSLSSFLGDWALLFCGALGAPLCVFTAYKVPFSWGEAVVMAVLITGFLTLMFGLPKYGPYCIVPFGAGVLAYTIFGWEKLFEGARLAVSIIQQVLSGTIGFIPPPMPEYLETAGISTTPFLGALVLSLGLFMAWGLCAVCAAHSPLRWRRGVSCRAGHPAHRPGAPCGQSRPALH